MAQKVEFAEVTHPFLPKAVRRGKRERDKSKETDSRYLEKVANIAGLVLGTLQSIFPSTATHHKVWINFF